MFTRAILNGLRSQNLGTHAKSSRRGVARWFGANFEGGPAGMDEPMRYFRQKLFVYGERVVGFGGVVVVPLIFGIILASDKSEFEARDNEMKDYFENYMHYPSIQRK